MISAYHANRSAEPGKEDDPTLFWQWKHDQPFHCDFCFVPAAWSEAISGVAVGSFDEWVATKTSDHVPLTVTIDHHRLA
jgi:endonuclease/exonuclease/phosphatase family metal-dependent hydrolase